MYKVINGTRIQKMPEGPTILRGDSGQWKQGQVLQDDEVEEVYRQVKKYPPQYELFAIPKPQPIETLFKEAMEKEALEYANGKYDRDKDFGLWELKHEEFCYVAEWAFNYLLTNKMIK